MKPPDPSFRMSVTSCLRDGTVVSRLTMAPCPCFSQWAPRGYADLIQSAWAQDPQQRPTATQIVAELEAMAEKECGRPIPRPAEATPLSPQRRESYRPPPGRQWRVDSTEMELNCRPVTLPRHIIRSLRSGRQNMTS